MKRTKRKNAREGTAHSLTVRPRSAGPSFSPAKIIADVLALFWGLRLAWDGLWSAALVTAFGFSLLGFALARGTEGAGPGRAGMRRFCHSLATPGRVVAHLFGAALVAFGIWARGSFYVFLGVTVVLLSHAFAWRGLSRERITESL